MSTALKELEARLSDIESIVTFAALAAQLRPRLGGVLNWAAAGHETELARRFIAVKDTRVEGIITPLIVQIAAALERFLRGLVEEAVMYHTSKVNRYEELGEGLRGRNIALTGALLATVESPRTHIPIHLEALVTNLASCVAGAGEFRLNEAAFTAAVTGISPAACEKALANVGIRDWWDGLGRNPDLEALLNVRGPRATGNQARSRLEELSRWRNHLAHGGDEEIALTENGVRDAIEFARTFARALASLAGAYFEA